MVRVAIHGAAGRMGRALIRLALTNPAVSLGAALESSEHPDLGKDTGSLAGLEPCGIILSRLSDPLNADVLLDFSSPEGTRNLLSHLSVHPIPLVSGTTGLSDADLASLSNLACSVPVIWSPNFSIGANLLFELVRRSASALGAETEVEIVEVHHHNKKDAPSGTAVRLAEEAATGLGQDITKAAIYGRHGLVGARKHGEIGLHAVRGGAVVGEHTVYFFSPYERLELTHRAESRDALASGALRVAEWLAVRPAAWYTMAQFIQGVTP